MTRRVVVTGIGVVAPGGVGVKQFWDLLTSGRTATRAISRAGSAPGSRPSATSIRSPRGCPWRTPTGSTGISNSGSSPRPRRSMTPASTLSAATRGGLA